MKFLYIVKFIDLDHLSCKTEQACVFGWPIALHTIKKFFKTSFIFLLNIPATHRAFMPWLKCNWCNCKLTPYI